MLLAPALARAQAYPTRPVRWVVPFPPGGFTTTISRTVADAMSRRLGQPFVVDNRPGAVGVIGAQQVQRSAPDGYTLLLGTFGTNGTLQILRPDLPYHVVRDFTQIGMIGLLPNVMLVNARLPVQTAAQFVEYARGRAGQLNYATAGSGSSSHLATEFFKLQTGVDLTHVPYQGAAQAMTALLAGDVHVYFDNATTAFGQIAGGAVRALGVTTRERLRALPDVPTLVEQRLDVEVAGWLGLLAPPGLPDALVAQLNAALNAAIAEPDVAAALDRQGLQAQPGTPAALRAYQEAELVKWGRVIPAARITME